MKVKAISLPNIFQVMFVLCFTRPRYQVSVYRTIGFSNIFSSETAWPIKPKIFVEHPWEGGMKVYINGLGHMTKMAAMPIYGKNL